MIVNFKIFEKLGDSIVKPTVVYYHFTISNSIIYINIKGKEYMVTLCLYDERGRDIMQGNDNRAILKIDFMVIDEKTGNYTGILTNDNDMLRVMANIVGTIKYWTEIDEDKDFHDINLVGIWISAKSEEFGDTRRSNIYKYYIKNNLEKIGIQIIEEKEITKKLKRRYGNDSELQIGMEYKITPITIGELNKKMK